MKNKKTAASVKVKETSGKPVATKKADRKIIESHKLAADHHIAAAQHHLDAAKHYEAGDYGQAAHSAILAYGHHAIAGEFLNDNAKHHAQTLKQTNYHH